MEILIYRCKHCGNIVYMVKKACACEPMCCGETMTLLKANTTDAAHEKHVPVIEHKDGKLVAKCGSVAHPMIEAHYMEWFVLVTESGVEFKYLKPGDAPEAVFGDAEHGTVYAYCNLHGLWKTEF